jgi:hypothetical protein
MTQLLRAAIVYDFDGTLAPHNLPEHSFLPAVGITADALLRVVVRGILGRTALRSL